MDSDGVAAKPAGEASQPAKSRPARGVVVRLDDYEQRHPWVGIPLAVVYKFIDDQGTYLAALITYYGFVSLFPLLLLAATILGFVLNGDSDLQQKLLGSALSQFPIIGKQITANIHGYRGSATGIA